MFTTGGVRGMVNVDSMDGTLMVQHYQAVHAERTRIEMLSKGGRAYLFHLIPVTVLVRWTTMTAAAEPRAPRPSVAPSQPRYPPRCAFRRN
jgi:hypothetical protein